MENCLNSEVTRYKDLEEYKSDVNNIIENMISQNERLVFALVCEKTDINPLTIRRYPELRSYILERMVYYKELHVINSKIDRVVNNLIKANKRITFLEIVNRCKFSSEMIYRNQYIKDRIRSVIALSNK
jgi:hypothetical protein